MSPSPIRCRGPWKIQKRSSEPDRWLDELGFFRKHTARDSSCLFRVVSENMYNTQRFFHKVRLDCIQFMASKRHLFEGSLTCSFENYLKEMSNPSESGGLIEISALSHLYRRDFVIFEANKGPQTKICNGFGETIYLFYSPESKHFDAVYTKDFINISSFSQSLVYEVLYDGVYQLKDLSYAVDKMLHDKVPSSHVEYFLSENVERRKKQKERAKIFIEATNDNDKDKNNNALALKCKHHTNDIERASLLKESLSIFVFNRSLIQLDNVCLNCLNVNSAKDLLDNGITPFPYKVAKALDPDIYRNIEFDVWSEMRREIRYGSKYSDGTTLQVGVKCLCRLQDEQGVPYHCHIQEMRPDGGPCLVFIEELGEKRVVNYEQLEPLPSEEVRPWAPPYRYSRANSQLLTLSQMLQQIGNMSRKQGLIKARNKSKSDGEENKSPTKIENEAPKLAWCNDTVPETTDLSHYQTDIDLSAYQHLDFVNFEPMPVELKAHPLMVDCRPAAGAPPQEMQAAVNGAAALPENHINQAGGSGDGMSPPAAPPTPATTALVTYNNAVAVGGQQFGCSPYVCNVKSVVWCAQPGAAPPPPAVNPHQPKSLQPNGSDLPMNDIPTLRYYFNLGVECMWAAYGAPPPQRHPRDLAHEMQQMSLNDRGGMEGHSSKPHGNKPHDNKQLNKGAAQRPLLPPRFKRGNNQDGNQNSNHQNKGHNNMQNKAMHHNNGAGGRARYEEEPALLPLPYLPYPPPMYPLPYYPVDDPAMLGMVGNVGYMGYEESEYMPSYYGQYPPPQPPPHPPHPPHPQHPQHPQHPPHPPPHMHLPPHDHK